MSMVLVPVKTEYEGGNLEMIQEFFVYGSLQPGNMNWQRVAGHCNNAERVSIPGHIRILNSGFGAMHIEEGVPQVRAKSWLLPNWTPKNYFPQPTVLQAKGWILTMQGTKGYFDSLDSFEGFRIGRPFQKNFYDRKAVWLNGRWVWTYTIPIDDERLDLVYEWTDDHYKNWNYVHDEYLLEDDFDELPAWEKKNLSWEEWLDGVPYKSAVSNYDRDDDAYQDLRKARGFDKTEMELVI